MNKRRVMEGVVKRVQLVVRVSSDALFTHQTRLAYRSSEAEDDKSCGYALINPLLVCYKLA